MQKMSIFVRNPIFTQIDLLINYMYNLCHKIPCVGCYHFKLKIFITIFYNIARPSFVLAYVYIYTNRVSMYKID